MRLEIKQKHIDAAVEWSKRFRENPHAFIGDERKLSCNCILAQALKDAGHIRPSVGITTMFDRTESGRPNYWYSLIGATYVTGLAAEAWEGVKPFSIEYKMEEACD